MEIELATEIGDVTVYPDRAQVTRRGAARLEAAGSHVLVVSGLPAGAQRDSLRAAGRGPAGTRILGVEQAPEYHAVAPEEALGRLRAEVARLEHDLALLDARAKTIEDERGWLRSLGQQSANSLARGMARGTAKPEDATSFFAYFTEESQRLATASLDLSRQRQDMQRELEARRREYAELGGGQRPDRVAARVRVELAEPGALSVELSYLIGGASWMPRYDARVDVDAARVHLTHEALVSQRTGEDWGQVALALSTARPSVAATLPDEPDPWYIDVLRPLPSVVGSAGMPRAAALFSRRSETLSDVAPVPAAASIPEAAALAPAELAMADVERSGAAQVFHLPGEVSVPSDGAPHTLALGEHDLPCRLDYVAAPVIAPGAHLRATADNSTGRVLLPGALHVFHTGAGGDEYVGATRLDLTAEGDDLILYLGVDSNVPVKHELIERDTDKGNLFQGGPRRVTIGYRVTLGNRTAAPQRIILKDRLPVPRNERIKLRTLDFKPQPTSRTRLDQLTWDLQVPPGQERQVEWRFVVEAPADVELIGLP
jgi:uncharacterized protein (TIGR02231 family)